MPKKSHTRGNRRDRRKAKQSGFAREGTSNPKKKGHHLYEHTAAITVESAIEGRKSCAEGVHEFVADVALGVRVCRVCGVHADLRTEDLAKKRGQGVQVPQEVIDRLAERPEPKSSNTSNTSERSEFGGTFRELIADDCRGPHDYRYISDLGIWQCRKCGAPKKE